MQTVTDFAWISLTSLPGCNYKQPIARRGKSVIIVHPQQPHRSFRIDAAKFDAGQPQFRETWCIEQWSDKAERTSKSEEGWQT